MLLCILGKGKLHFTAKLMTLWNETLLLAIYDPLGNATHKLQWFLFVYVLFASISDIGAFSST